MLPPPSFKRAFSDITGNLSSMKHAQSFSELGRSDPLIQDETKCTFCPRPAVVACYRCDPAGHITPLCLPCNQMNHDNDGTVDGWGQFNHFRCRLKYHEGELLPDEDRYTEYKSVAKHKRGPKNLVTLKCMKLINGFLNSGGGCIYFGVSEELNKETRGLVHPVEYIVYTRAMREEIRKVVENKVMTMYPAVASDLYQVVFVPIECSCTSKDHSTHSKLPINSDAKNAHDDLAFLLCIHVRRGLSPLYVCRPPLCFSEICEGYERKDSSTCRINVSDTLIRLGTRAVPPPLSNGFSDEILRLITSAGREVVYRGSLVAWINDAIKHSSSGEDLIGKVLLLTDGPGTGKSVFMADMIRRSKSWRRWKYRSEMVTSRHDAHRVFWADDWKDLPDSSDKTMQMPDTHSKSCTDMKENEAMQFNVLAYHFCQAGDSRTVHPGRFVRSIAALVVTSTLHRVRHFFGALDTEEVLSEERAFKDPDFAFEKGILAPLRSMPAPRDKFKNPSRYVILVDALDESMSWHDQRMTHAQLSVKKTESGFINNSHSIAELLHRAYIEGRFPSWLTIVCTSRPDPRVDMWSGSFRKLSMREHGRIDADILPTYVRSRLKDIISSIDTSFENDSWSDSSLAEATNFIVARSEHNFLYASMLLHAIEGGQMQLDNIRTTPPGVNSLFFGFMDHAFRHGSFSFDDCRPLFEIIMASYYPLTNLCLKSTLRDSVNAVEQIPHLLTINRVSSTGNFRYSKWRKNTTEFKSIEPSTPPTDDVASPIVTYSFFHNSLSDWLQSSQAGEFHCDKGRGHALLAAADLRMIKFSLLTKRFDISPETNDQTVLVDIIKIMKSLESHIKLWMGDSYVPGNPNYSVKKLQSWNEPARGVISNDINPNLIQDIVLHLIDSKIGSWYERIELLHLFLSSHLPESEQWDGKCSVLDNTDNQNRTALFLLCSSQQVAHVDAITLLLNAKADPSICSKDGLSALNMAARRGFRDVCELLVGTGQIPIDLSSRKNHTALHTSARRGYIDIVRLLILSKANVDLGSRGLRTALYAAAEENHLKIVRILLVAKASLDMMSVEGQSVLWIAASRGHVDIVTEFLHQKRSISQELMMRPSFHGVTPICIASANGNSRVVHTLLCRNASPWTMSNQYQTPLWLAVNGQHEETIKVLIKYIMENDILGVGKDMLRVRASQLMNAAALSEWKPLKKARLPFTYQTPFFRTVIQGNLNIVELLLHLTKQYDLNLNVNLAESVVGRTALMDAAYFGREDLIEILIKAHNDGVIELDINATEDDGGNAVSDACFQGHMVCAKFLLDAKGTLNVLDRAGISPLMYAASRGYVDVVDLLVSRMSEGDILSRGFSTLDVVDFVIGKLDLDEKKSERSQARSKKLEDILKAVCFQQQLQYLSRSFYFTNMQEIRKRILVWYSVIKCHEEIDSADDLHPPIKIMEASLGISSTRVGVPPSEAFELAMLTPHPIFPKLA